MFFLQAVFLLFFPPLSSFWLILLAKHIPYNKTDYRSGLLMHGLHATAIFFCFCLPARNLNVKGSVVLVF